ncbi:uncharacterized protein LOC125664798 [Ostrea edulis]|uniref:uncharacterized protein LOC125664798 n=1 Tax=Ostrea edulis TaxID=37623 RepID=UPI0024AED092|nr:uncharacterized protein LOC125664798 [Ostrea edulis]
MMKPDVTTTVVNKQYSSTAKHCGSVVRDFSKSDAVNVRDYRANSEKWANGRIHSQTGPLSYKVDINGTLWRRHVDQIVGTSKDQPSNSTSIVTADIPFIPSVNTSGTTDKLKDQVTNSGTSATNVEPRRNPTRNRKKPDRLNL